MGARLLALSISAEAQQTKKVPRIGYLSIYDPARGTRIEVIRLALRERGYHRRNITSPSSTDMRRGGPNGLLSERPN
jgi:hypothetical protein